MRANGLRGASRAKRRFTTHSDKTAVRAPDLVKRDFTAVRPNEKWVADFTYCSTWSGVIYVAFITDVFSRRIVGWKASRSMTATLVVDALNMAAWVRRGVDIDGVICHSDAGGQYVSIAYTDRLDDIGAAPSIGTIGDSYDNAMAESVIGLFKTELHRNPAALAANGGHWHGLDDLSTATWDGSGGSTRNASTASSTTSPQPSSKPPTPSAVSARQRHEKSTQEHTSDPVRFTRPLGG